MPVEPLFAVENPYVRAYYDCGACGRRGVTEKHVSIGAGKTQITIQCRYCRRQRIADSRELPPTARERALQLRVEKH